jgi:enamine deaminase RidA (YjgF/YER057c/UK114 family)
MSADKKLTELGITLPTPTTPRANFVTSVQTGNLLYLAGHGPIRDGSVPVVGQLGAELNADEGYRVARSVGINLLATARAALGSLDRVVRVVKVLGMVNSAPKFTEQPKVINGFSDLMVEVFGDAGRHARSAVGMAQLPNGMPVEIEMILEVR